MARTWGGVSTDKVAVPAYAEINSLGNQTWAVWTYRTGNGGGTFGRILDKRNAAAEGSGGIVLFNAGGTNYYFESHLWATVPGSWRIAVPSANVWHHLCVVYEPGVPPIWYVDGISQTVTEDSGGSGTYGTETEPLNIGNRTDGTRNWEGPLAELSCHNVLLTGTDVANLAAGRLASSIPTGLVLYLPIIGAASPEPNLASAGNPGVVTGTVQSAHPPVDGQAGPGGPATVYQLFEG